jgi:ATP-binding cassette, subfamily C (CFTR/MRP), member 1
MSDLDCSALDSSWGPWAGRYCRGGLDFTLFFEEVVFVILPAAVLVLVTVLKAAWLMRTRVKMAQRGTLLLLKQV